MSKSTFSEAEREVLLAIKGVGPKVVERFEQLGINTLKKLAMQDAQAICEQTALLVGGTCWKNSPRARSAVAAAIAAAQSARIKCWQKTEPTSRENRGYAVAQSSRIRKTAPDASGQKEQRRCGTSICLSSSFYISRIVPASSKGGWSGPIDSRGWRGELGALLVEASVDVFFGLAQ
jgi:hypothetical protein